jgi:hypothetical protein
MPAVRNEILCGLGTTMRAASTHPRQRRLSFPPHTEGLIGLGLDFARQVLAEWHLLIPPPQAPHLADDTALVVGELLANACRHGHGPRELCLEQRPDCLHIAVSDHNPAPPVRRSTGPATPGGHGMRIVEHLTAWGTEADSEGKTVWADLPLTGES